VQGRFSSFTHGACEYTTARTCRPPGHRRQQQLWIWRGASL